MTLINLQLKEVTPVQVELQVISPIQIGAEFDTPVVEADPLFSLWLAATGQGVVNLSHSHVNKAILDKFTESAGQLLWDGNVYEDGREVELQSGATHIQWRYVGDALWQDLVALSDITGLPGSDGVDGAPGLPGSNGSDGVDGREVELQKSATHVQWKYVTDSVWIDLIALVDLKGDTGADGAAGADGREVELQKTTTHIQWRYVGGSWTDLVALVDLKGADGADGVDGAAGVDGKEVELQKSATHIQWRYVGEAIWIDLVALADIKGDKGDKGDDGVDGLPGAAGVDGTEIELQEGATHIQWKYVTDVTWTDLIAIADITGSNGLDGTNGQEISLQKTATHIQWRLGSGAWQDLVALTDLKGDKGDQGDPGLDGSNGADGVDGDSAFVYIAYASDSSGTGFTLTFNAALDYIAILSTVTEIVTPIVTDFAGLWKNYKGATGAAGTTPAKAIGTDIDTGTDDDKYVTSKAIADSKVAFYPLQVGSLTLTAASWTTGVTFKEYELSNANISAADIVEVIPDNADYALVQAAEILPATISAAGTVTIYANNIPTDDIGVTINITRKQ